MISRIDNAAGVATAYECDAEGWRACIGKHAPGRWRHTVIQDVQQAREPEDSGGPMPWTELDNTIMHEFTHSCGFNDFFGENPVAAPVGDLFGVKVRD